jgi:hypothetical protein
MGDNRKHFKYPALKDGAWLVKCYCDDQMSTAEIAGIVGCNKNTVRIALLELGVVLRSNSESTIAQVARRGLKSFRYPLLNDKDWLQRNYLVEGKSLDELKALVGAKNHNSVRQALERFGMVARSISDGLTHNREDDGFSPNASVIDGTLLGDAFLSVYNKTSELSYPSYCKRNKHIEHHQYVGDLLFGDNWVTRVKEQSSICNGKVCNYHLLRSLSHKELMSYHRRWYPVLNNYIKCIPEDIVINEEVLLHWFLDDGSSSYRKRDGKKTNQVLITFCSESFEKADQERLCDQIHEKFPTIKPKIMPCQWGTGWRIKILQAQANAFYEIIGLPPVASLAYKWKRGIE